MLLGSFTHRETGAAVTVETERSIGCVKLLLRCVCLAARDVRLGGVYRIVTRTADSVNIHTVNKL